MTKKSIMLSRGNQYLENVLTIKRKKLANKITKFLYKPRVKKISIQQNNFTTTVSIKKNRIIYVTKKNQ